MDIKNRTALFFLMFCVTIGQVAPGAFSEDPGPDKSLLVFDQYNLRVKVPPTWSSLPTNDPHFIASLASNSQPTFHDTRYSIFVTELKDGLTLKELMARSAQGKAYEMQQRNLIRLGKEEEVEVMGLKGQEDMFSFTVSIWAFTYVVVGFEKNGMGYIFDFWCPRGQNSKMAFDRFRSWLKSGVTFIDPEKDISEETKLQIKKFDESLSLKASTPVSIATSQSPIRSVADFTRASHADQKQFMEKRLPEDTEIRRLGKQAMLAEHAGKFGDAKGYYEQMLQRKEEAVAAFGESGWAMLYPAVQRMSELTGDEMREKEMLVWIRDNMLAAQGMYHQYLSGLLPQVQDHLKDRIKKFDLK